MVDVHGRIFFEEHARQEDGSWTIVREEFQTEEA
jgi:hypothetical protein